MFRTIIELWSRFACWKVDEGVIWSDSQTLSQPVSQSVSQSDRQTDWPTVMNEGGVTEKAVVLRQSESVTE